LVRLYAAHLINHQAICNLESSICNFMTLIECVPNVSEGRRPAVLADLASAVTSVPGVRLLDYSGDPSHNRSVFTMAGGRQAIFDAVLALYERAVTEIDLRVHRGEHPRLGAVDVVPFVPLSGATMDACVRLAEAVGDAVAARFGIPVYLYEAAARNPARRRLEDIRRGGFEGLAARMERPDWIPDFGPARPHPTAGASVIGARRLLIAYNVNLATRDLDIARQIAAAIRERQGGLPGVKALGLRLPDRGIVQVSMNLTDHERTSMKAAYDAVAREAAARHVEVLESELIGLAPLAALGGAAPEDLKLRNFTEDMILERRLQP
jgi:glutamate formiminotransferase